MKYEKYENIADRNHAMLAAKSSGATIGEIASRFGLTVGKVTQIVSKDSILRRAGRAGFKGLPIGVITVLQIHGIKSLADAQRLSETELSKMSYIGLVLAKQIKQWPS
jgi:hypothetical protein